MYLQRIEKKTKVKIVIWSVLTGLTFGILLTQAPGRGIVLTYLMMGALAGAAAGIIVFALPVIFDPVFVKRLAVVTSAALAGAVAGLPFGLLVGALIWLIGRLLYAITRAIRYTTWQVVVLVLATLLGLAIGLGLSYLLGWLDRNDKLSSLDGLRDRLPFL